MERTDWPVMGVEAMSGLPGRVVNMIAPGTEADFASLLLDFLVAAGSAIGPGPFITPGSKQQDLRLYGLVVGDTAKARKGTSRSDIQQVMGVADRLWSEGHILSGLSSGEGLINALNSMEAGDRRALVVESEFARVLAVATKEGATLSAVIRDAWDTNSLNVLTRGNPLKVTNAHVSIIGHITITELITKLSASDHANGFANRFLFVCARRTKLLPFGGGLPLADRERLGYEVGRAVLNARKLRHVSFADEARDTWAEMYAEIASRPRQPNIEHLVARADVHVHRLAGLYAVLDGSDQMQAWHLRAALAFWDYCEASIGFIFSAVHSPMTERLYSAIESQPDGMDKTAMYRMLGRVTASVLDDALEVLVNARRVYVVAEQGRRGAPKAVYLAAARSEND